MSLGPLEVDEKSDNIPAALPEYPRSVTLRAILIALAIMPINAYWVVMMERVRYSAHPTTVSLFFNCVFILVVLTGINAIIVRTRARKHALNQGEMMLIYTMLCIGSCLAGHDTGQILVPSLTWPYSQATPVNGYASLFWSHLPRWALVANVDATKGFWAGNDTLYTRQHLLAWAEPTIVWTGFMVVLLFVMQCVNSLIRRQWTEYERLTFPLTRIPLEITRGTTGALAKPEKSLYTKRLFWLGFVVAASIDAINSLNYYFPNIPSILTPGNGQSFIDLGQFATQKPWNAIGWTPLSFYPFVIGLGMLMPTDFLFSSWFFYLVWKLQSVVCVANAWDGDPRMPYANYQAFGAYAMFCVSTLYISRHYFKQIFQVAIGRSKAIDDTEEPLSYRGAFLGLACGILALTAFSVALGLSWWLGILFFLIYLVLALAITRMRAELGTPVHDLHFTGPDWTITDLLGSRAIGPQNLAVFSLFFWFNRAYRGHPMPFQMEGFKLAEQTSAKREMRGWFWAMLLAGFFGMLCAFWAMLHCYYIYGGLAKCAGTFGSEAWDRYAGWIKQPKGGSVSVALAIVVGFAFSAFLQAMRVRFAWWPFHPLAYAVSGSWEMNLLWMPLLIAWVIKTITLRYFGGPRGYSAVIPFFYGLILGQFIPGSLLNIWGIATGTPTYQFWQ